MQVPITVFCKHPNFVYSYVYNMYYYYIDISIYGWNYNIQPGQGTRLDNSHNLHLKLIKKSDKKIITYKLSYDSYELYLSRYTYLQGTYKLMYLSCIALRSLFVFKQWIIYYNIVIKYFITTALNDSKLH